MGISPLYKGHVNPPASFYPQTDSRAVSSLSGVSPSQIIIHLYNAALEPLSSATKVCSGTISIDSSNTFFTYQWQSADVDTPGLWKLYVEAAGIPFDPVDVLIFQWR